MSNEETPRRVLSLKRETREGAPVVEERLQKVMAQAGIGSRRAIEERISAGEIKVNGNVAELGSSIRNGDRVEIDGKSFIAMPTPTEEVQLLMYHKPEGELTTTDDPDGRRTVFERLPKLKGARWIAIGRLDMNTTGLLLLTTDGELANAMMHPSREVEREYVCRIHGTVTDDILERLKNGVQLDDGSAQFDEIHTISLGETHSWFRVTLREGRNREVRRMWEAVGMLVSRLKRIRYGTIDLPRQLRRGHYQALPIDQIVALRKELGLGDVPDTLTLQAVLGVRRAQKSVNEFRPSGKAEGWSGQQDEGRELRAFDRVSDDGFRRDRKPGSGARRGKPGGKPGGGGFKPGGPRPAGGKPGGFKGKPRRDAGPATGAHSGPERGNSFGGEQRASHDDDNRGNRIDSRPARPAGNFAPGPGPGAGKPRREGGGGNKRGPTTFTGPMDSHSFMDNPRPQGRGPGGPSGPRPGGSRPGGSRPGGSRPGGQRPGGGGKPSRGGPPRGPR
ncbi:MAG: pseudouridine synthase [Rhodanobacteraceae bacterium]|nr:pseudouridine synthase [Rhodanobacteraceae bacterium]